MAVVTRTKANVRPLPGAVCRNAIAASAIELGEIVSMTATGNKVEPGSNANASVVGVCVAVGTEGKDAAVTGDPISVLLWGPVQGWSGMTPGALHYLSDTAGELDTASSTAKCIMGVAWEATIFLFAPNLSPVA